MNEIDTVFRDVNCPTDDDISCCLGGFCGCLVFLAVLLVTGLAIGGIHWLFTH